MNGPSNSMNLTSIIPGLVNWDGYSEMATTTLVQYSTLTASTDKEVNNVPPGTLGQVYTSNGASAYPSFKTLNIGFTQIVQQIITSTGTYTPTAGMKYACVEMVGGGGGGGGVVATTAGNYGAGAGGGGGFYNRAIFDASTIGVSQAATIGAGGTAGSTTGGSGGTGGTSSLGSLLSSVGGAGGIGLTATSPIGARNRGALPSIGTHVSAGSEGTYGFWFSGLAFGGNGGASYFADGASGSSATAGSIAGTTALKAGGGGSGAINLTSATGVLGGAGAAGIIIITEYI